MNKEKELLSAETGSTDLAIHEENKELILRENKKKEINVISEEIGLNMLPIVIVGFISVRLSAFNHFLEFIQGGDIMLTSALILASTLARTINKRIKKGFKYLMIIAMIIELIEYSLNYTNPFKSLAAIVVESGVALMSSVAFSIISAIQEEEK